MTSVEQGLRQTPQAHTQDQKSLDTWRRSSNQCGTCTAHRAPAWRRRVGVPHSYQFGGLVALDTVFIKLCEKTHPVLNIVDHGTNFQTAIRLIDHTAQQISRALTTGWTRISGNPEVVLTDGGPEFQGHFIRTIELLGVMHVVANADSPRENSRCERHGELLKDMLDKLADTSIIDSPGEPGISFAEAVSLKNRTLHRGGLSPHQLAFGINPREWTTT